MRSSRVSARSTSGTNRLTGVSGSSRPSAVSCIVTAVVASTLVSEARS